MINLFIFFVSNCDLDELAQLAHWLKGSGGTAGFHEFTDLARELEQLAREGADDTQIPIILGEIEAIAGAIVVPELASPASDVAASHNQ